ncbi:ebp domain-containing protein [Rutstroemia sp. NJR-2017a WRK4]|nr:ebp domain-containing protein [Rutstroemia sp. NJR-2017a WRK4]
MNRIWNKYMTVATTSQHPYYPLDVKLSGEYVENDWSVSYLITAFGALWTLLLGVTLVAVRRVNHRLSAKDQGLVLWFVLSTGMAVVRFNSVAAGSIHIFFEGYFIYNHARMASMQDFFGQLWKEYALSDSRYMSSDPFLLTIEFWTIILWGPLSYVAAILIVKDSPFRHSVQALVSTGEFYGNLLYLLTSLLDEKLSGISYYRPEPFYFWVYFVLMNSIWLFVPAYCLYDSVMASARSFVAARSIERGSHRKKIR